MKRWSKKSLKLFALQFFLTQISALLLGLPICTGTPGKLRLQKSVQGNFGVENLLRNFWGTFPPLSHQTNVDSQRKSSELNSSLGESCFCCPLQSVFALTCVDSVWQGAFLEVLLFM